MINLHCSPFNFNGSCVPKWSRGTQSEFPVVQLILHGGSSFGRCITKADKNVELVENRILSVINTANPTQIQSQNSQLSLIVPRKIPKIFGKLSKLKLTSPEDFFSSPTPRIHAIRCKFIASIPENSFKAIAVCISCKIQ